MNRAIILTVALIGLVAGNGAWERNKEYTYKLLGRTLKPSPESNNKFVGVISRAYLTIRPQSDNLLIGQISRAEYGKVNETLTEEWISNLDSRILNNWPLNKPFKVHLENGVIRSLSVDASLTNYEVNQLKVIMSQFQVDSRAQNQIQLSENQLPEKYHSTAFYKTMEPLVTGNCETVYEISAIPDYLIQAHPEWIPVPELKGAGDFIQITKSRSHVNCHETSGYLLDMAGRKDSNTNEIHLVRMNLSANHNLYVTEDRRIVVSGSLERYTIQSSVTFNKVNNVHDNRLTLTDLVNVTLESVVDTTDRSGFAPENLTNLKNTGNLVYTFDLEASIAPTKSNPQQLLLSTTPTNDTNITETWSSCWTAFPSAGSICKNNFSPEYSSVNTRSCGFLGLGKQALCKLY
ncbi:vitellogenin-like isoform X2 [Bradysia coprophila]|nr:vitellogenin-like isoform X2 [Bradysia coprophila]